MAKRQAQSFREDVRKAAQKLANAQRHPSNKSHFGDIMRVQLEILQAFHGCTWDTAFLAVVAACSAQFKGETETQKHLRVQTNA
jgi:hypothetical protein